MKEIFLTLQILFSIVVNIHSYSLYSPHGALSTFVNFEKYYNIEEELITLADLILKQELRAHDGEDVHDILNMTSTIEDAKNVHRGVGLSMRDYLRHPINTFHLTKRLATHWRQIVGRLMKSSTCVKNLKVKLQNIEDSLPERKDFTNIAHTLTSLNLYGGFSLADVVKGDIGGHSPRQALSLADISDVAKAAYDMEDYFYAFDWLKYVYAKMKSSRLSELENGVTIGNEANLLASIYFKMGFYDNAKATLSDLLRIDAKNKMAKRNLDYYKTLRSKSKSGKPVRRPPKKKSQRNYEEICRSKTPKMVSKSTRLQCMYFPSRKITKIPYLKSLIKAEVINKTPLVVMFYDVFGDDTAKAISYLGYKQMTERSQIGHRSAKQQSIAVTDKTFWRWVPKLQKTIFDLKMGRFPPMLMPFSVTEVGLEGFKLGNKSTSSFQPVGSYLSFLTESSLGGEIVFPLSRLKIPVSKGDMIFYDNHAKMMICPVLYGSQWYGVQPLFEHENRRISLKRRRTTI